MKKLIFIITIVIFLVKSNTFCEQNKTNYEPYIEDAILKQMREQREEAQKKKDELTDKIKKQQQADKDKEKQAKKELRSDLTGITPPQSVDDFKSYFYFPPVSQYATSVCWCFAGTSFWESEIFRLTGKKIKLSVMWTVYHEYLEKVGRFIDERGESRVAEGGEQNALKRVWKKYGVVPQEVYPGVLNPSQKYDTTLLKKEIADFIEYIKKTNLWDKEDSLNHLKLVLDKHLGMLPKTFVYNDKEMTALEFLKNETGLNLDDYEDVLSTSYFPFYTRQEFLVPDNWWHDKNYINLPLDVWYDIIVKSIKSGYTLAIGGDTSEPGKQYTNNLGFIPTFDIPAEFINQDSREYRIANKTTDDDHNMHLVGYVRIKDNDWFLIKDSSASAYRGKFNGYYFFRGDYVKLKMLTYTVHKDMLKEILPKIKLPVE